VTDLHEQPPPPPAPPSAPVTKHPHQDEEVTGTHPARLLILVALLGFAFWRAGWALPVVILGVVVMIFLHELGHYLAAKWGGMKVTEFFIGFGPKIWSFRRGETEYGLKVIPAGAYVKIIGMNNLDEVAPGDEARTYRSKSYPRRLLVAVAGSAMHFAQALLLLFVLYAFVGVPGGSLTEVEDWEVGQVVPDSGAEAAALQPGDRIAELDGRSVETFEDFSSHVATIPGEDVVLTVVRDGEPLTVPATIGVSEDDPDRGLLGIRMERTTTKVGPVAAVGSAIGDFGEQSAATLRLLGEFFTPGGISDFAGDVARGGEGPAVQGEGSASGGSGAPAAEAPDEGRVISIVGAVQIGSNLTEQGMLGFLLFFIGINITIGIFNLLPVLPLDGGHVVVATYERLRELGKPRGERHHVDFARLIPVVYAVFVVLVLLGMTTIYNDIVNPIAL
jgi:membrane-associated protease RseP (regulator of RpoE activity)